jgi:hypothetical protein
MNSNTVFYQPNKTAIGSQIPVTVNVSKKEPANKKKKALIMKT